MEDRDRVLESSKAMGFLTGYESKVQYIYTYQLMYTRIMNCLLIIIAIYPYFLNYNWHKVEYSGRVCIASAVEKPKQIWKFAYE